MTLNEVLIHAVVVLPTPIPPSAHQVVEFLKDPKTFSKLGARPPKGILLEGEPGTGKTLMAKALAGEAMVPFYQVGERQYIHMVLLAGRAVVGGGREHMSEVVRGGTSQGRG